MLEEMISVPSHLAKPKFMRVFYFSEYSIEIMYTIIMVEGVTPVLPHPIGLCLVGAAGHKRPAVFISIALVIHYFFYNEKNFVIVYSRL